MPKRSPIRHFLSLLLLILEVYDVRSFATTYKVLYGFSGGVEGGGLYSGVVLDAGGNLYGGTYGGGTGAGTIYQLKHKRDGSWTERVIRTLDLHNDGGYPNEGMAFDAAGNLYGTTEADGPGGAGGTVFQLVPNPSGEWSLNVLYDVGSQGAGVMIDPAGNLYGLGAGAFELSPTPDGWTYQQIYDFSREGDGGGFYSAMIRDTSGNLYGTTFGGGIPEPYCLGGAGAARCSSCIRMRTARGRSVGCTGLPPGRTMDSIPMAEWCRMRRETSTVRPYREASTARSTGYASSAAARSTNCRSSLTGGGRRQFSTTIRRTGAWGGGPEAGPTLDADGNLYGTAGLGGDSFCSCGVIYKLTHNPDDTWTYQVLHRFEGSDGAEPSAPLVMDKKGNLYGTTITGGPGGKGVVFKITP